MHELARLLMLPDSLLPGIVFGLVAYVVLRCVLTGFYTVDQNERAVVTTFGRARRLREDQPTPPNPGPMREGGGIAEPKRDELLQFPQLQIVRPGGPYFKWPWQRVHKVPVATQTIDMAWDPEDPRANNDGTMLEAVTKDQLNTGVMGQIRYRVAEENLYAYLFGVKRPIAHVMGFFVSILRERIASFTAPSSGHADGPDAAGVSINDLRKNLRALNEHMDRECAASTPRFGITLEASLITEIHSPPEVESALAAINTAHNQVASDISLARAAADQKIVQSRRAVEIETLRAQAEVEPLEALAAQLSTLKQAGPDALAAYVRNVRLGTYARAERVVEVR
jgi:regulator of protease activity HflC (stomatin/prohibitin superfamily)